MRKQYNIAVAGTGYVGLSMATLLSLHHHVIAVDAVAEKYVGENYKLNLKIKLT